MGRSSTPEYVAAAKYSIYWGTNRNECTNALAGTHAEAMQRARDLVDEMRRDGARSAIRTVTVRKWSDWDRETLTYRSPPLLEASYYDQEQGLSADDAYAARVHDWHAVADSVNAQRPRASSTFRMGLRPWAEAWGPAPTQCPRCRTPIPLVSVPN